MIYLVLNLRYFCPRFNMWITCSQCFSHISCDFPLLIGKLRSLFHTPKNIVKLPIIFFSLSLSHSLSPSFYLCWRVFPIFIYFMYAMISICINIYRRTKLRWIFLYAFQRSLNLIAWFFIWLSKITQLN